jgi:hypothetical protein
MLRLAAVALSIIVLGVAIGALIASTIPPASKSHAASGWGDGVGNHRDAATLASHDRATIDDESARLSASPPAQPAARAETAELPYSPDDRDRIDGRDAPGGAAAYNDNGGDAPDPLDDRAAQAADAARDAADEARTAGAAPPGRDDR